MIRRTSVVLGLAVLVGLGVTARPGTAQLARPRVAAPDAPKLLVAPFQRDNPDSALSLVVADGVRDRLRTVHTDKFNTIQRQSLNTLLTESGFPIDVPIDPANLRQVVRHLNARYLVEGSMIRHGDSILVIARLAESQGTMPQSASFTVTLPASRIGAGTGSEIANNLVEGYRTFDEVTECRHKLDLNDPAGATAQALRALRQNPNSAGAWLCIARIRESAHAPEDSILAALRNAYTRDTLSTAVMRALATRYQARNDTTNLLDMLKRILAIDFRDNELRISTAQLMVRMSQPDSAVTYVNKGLEYNPASVELLGVKAVAMAAGAHWDSAYAALQTVSEIDTSKIDSLFIYRMTNYARQIPDTTKWQHWLGITTQRSPHQLDPWYALASQKMMKGDSAGAEEAARGLLQNSDASTASGRAYTARAQWILATMLMGHGRLDSALAHADMAVQADSAIRPQVAVIFYMAGASARADTARTGHLEQAVELLTRARDYGAANPRLLVPASFQLGISQFQLGAQIDARAQEGRSCEMARTAKGFIDSSEANIIAGVATNRELANQFLSQYIPAYKQREDAMIRQYCR